MALVDGLLRRALPLIPRPLVAPVARRYVVGTTQDQALTAVRKLEASGLEATLDLLGENAATPREADEVRDEYLRLIAHLDRERLRAHLSVKPTHLGLRLGEEGALDRIARLVESARASGRSVRLDMEDSSTTDATLRIYRSLGAISEGVGVAIQAALRRSRADVESLAELRPNVRVCKGIYVEAEEIAYRDAGEIRRSFLQLVDSVLAAGGHVAVATHDRYLVDGCLERVHSVQQGSHEFEMLAGVGHELRPRILAAGSSLRVYCPYGPEWYDYSLRRLRENPRLLRQVLAGALRGGMFRTRP